MIPRTVAAAFPLISKPRASGDDPGEWDAVGQRYEVNPARAGMIPNRSNRPRTCARKPRASGDDPCDATSIPWVPKVNPARAGMILALGGLGRQVESKPRASGDDPVSVFNTGQDKG